MTIYMVRGRDLEVRRLRGFHSLVRSEGGTGEYNRKVQLLLLVTNQVATFLFSRACKNDCPNVLRHQAAL